MVDYGGQAQAEVGAAGPAGPVGDRNDASGDVVSGQGQDIWNRKAVRGTTKIYEPDGSPYQGVYNEGEWQTYNADNIDPTDLIPAKALRKGAVLAIKALTTTTDQFREIIRGDIQDYNVVEYDSVFDLVNGERVNEQIYYDSGRNIGTESIKTNQNVTRSIELRTCYLGTIGC